MQAYIGGIVSISTVDWPKNICTVVFFGGCDFKCPYCYNSDIVYFKEELKKDIHEIKEEIRKNSDFIDAVLFSGGEACLQLSPVLHLAKFVKKLELKVGLETNGTKPNVLKQLISEKLIDFVALDMKAPFDLALFEKVTRGKTFFKDTKVVIENIKETLQLLEDHDDELEIEIRTTVVPSLIYKKQDILGIAKIIKNIHATWRLQQYRPDIGKPINENYKNIDSPSLSFLNNLKEACLKEYPNLRIEVKGV